MLKEFKEFINKGNVLGLGVAVVMAGAFGAVVKALVDNLIMPLVGALTAGIDFSKLQITIAGVTFMIGNFINAVITFFIVSFVMFIIVKAYNKTQKPKEEAPAAPSKEEVLLTEIRDLLKNK